ncbi:MAG: LysR family transcriptional regulator [Phenylobacterium sp.]|uniref:LysR family transcriptional regulator n=1 Tax=Phenylobacterium sp. TaxID=1871053 RepID=UPI0027326C86|nr:LysR family transcriptional regulator [Phenylobacterium sp.]MDP3748929.1 LysR family transcriptional regulator [Phenylobacterium sp.]
MAQLDLGDLDAFAAIARHRSFRRAAAARGVSPSSLSQTLRDLEARLGVRLLNRTTRSVAPTEAGQRLLDRLSPALADIAAAVDQVTAAPGHPAGTVRINAPEPAVELVLAPMVAPFLAAHPQVRLEIVAQTSFIDIVAEGFDAGVRWDESLARDMIAVSLGPPQRFTVVAAPEVVARYGRPEVPGDMLGKPCIRQRFPGGVDVAWEFERDGEVVRIEPEGPLVSTSIPVQMRAALEGVGFWSTFEGYVREHVAEGRLVAVLEDWQESFPGPFLYYPSRRQMPSALRAFIDFVKVWKAAPT